jgi:glycosyltransferase involved in cell wall biosynthesis
MVKFKSLTAIVPFYNEEAYIEESLSSLISTGLFSEIILVNNNSSDNSVKIVSKYLLDYSYIQLINATEKKGKGYAVLEGIKQTTSTHVIVHDADLEYSPLDIKEMLEIAKMHPNDLILGSRIIGNKIRKNVYFYTYFMNRLFSLLFSVINLYKISDISSCYQINLTKNLLNMNLKENGFAMEVEILSKHIKTNNLVREVPISYTGRSYKEGKKIKLVDALRIISTMLKHSKLNIFFDRV